MRWGRCEVCGHEKYCYDGPGGATPAKTRADVERLKEGWINDPYNDPYYDIEDTPGFEAFKGELKAFREGQEAAWAQEREEKRCAHAGQIARSVSMPLTVRDQFAMAALEGVLSSASEEDCGTPGGIASCAYAIADAMLLERLKESTPP